MDFRVRFFLTSIDAGGHPHAPGERGHRHFAAHTHCGQGRRVEAVEERHIGCGGTVLDVIIHMLHGTGRIKAVSGPAAVLGLVSSFYLYLYLLL